MPPFGPGASGGGGVTAAAGLFAAAFFAGFASGARCRLDHGGLVRKPAWLRGIRGQQFAAPLRDGLRALLHLERERVIDGFKKALAVSGKGGFARGHQLVLHHARGTVGGALAGDGVVERGAERVDVRPGTLLAACLGILLVGRVARFDERRDGLRMRRDLAACGAEVDQDGRAVLADDDVVRGDVAVQEVLLVDQLQGVEERRDDRVELLLTRGPFQALQPRLEAWPSSKWSTM